MTGGRDELAELLQRAGLEIVEGPPTEVVLPPRAAWRPVVSFEAEPTVAVRLDRPDLVAELNDQWHRLAVKAGIVGKDGVFLIDVAGNWTDCATRAWTRVRLAAQWDLAGVLGERPGRPEFVTLSTDGITLLGATSEEYEVWLIAVDRVRERQEAAAQEKPGSPPRSGPQPGPLCFKGRALRAGCESCGRMGLRATRPRPMTYAPACWACHIPFCGARCPRRSWRRR